MIGRAWTREEIARLVETFEGDGDTSALSRELGRSHEAVLAKAGRLQLKRRWTDTVQPETLAAMSR